jgi:hypothetical protein
MIASRTEYSSDLSAYLDLGGTRHVLGQLGPEYLILRDAAHAPPGRAEIVMFHDGEESRLSVMLPRGIAESDCKIPYQKLAANS